MVRFSWFDMESWRNGKQETIDPTRHPRFFDSRDYG
jgi:hypothetical protein